MRTKMSKRTGITRPISDITLEKKKKREREFNDYKWRTQLLTKTWVSVSFNISAGNQGWWDEGEEILPRD